MYNLSKYQIDLILGDKIIKPLILKPFDNNIVDFFLDLSNLIIFGKGNRNHKDLIYFGSFLREKNQYRVDNEFKLNRLARGLVLHICTENVPLNFAYSLFFGLLYGNTNLVKLPEKNFTQNTILINYIIKLLKIKKYSYLKKYIYLFKFDKNVNTSNYLSSISDVRMIWGSDKTIAIFKKFETKSRVVDLFFSSRKSICLIDLSSFKKMSNTDQETICEKFFKDNMFFDQLGCSSPNTIIWLTKNTQTSDKLINLFWKKFLNIFKEKYDIDFFQSSKRFEMLSEIVISEKGFKSISSFNDFFYVLDHDYNNFDIDLLRSYSGIFHQFKIDKLESLKFFSSKSIQTLATCGINKEKIFNTILKNSLPGIDRIVDLGESLKMSQKWDGYDLKNTLTRVIDL